jgi:Tol biopolymer transport system component
MRWSPDGQRLAYVGNLGLSTAYDLYVTNVVGASVAVVPQLPADREIQTFEWSGDNNWLAFIASTTADAVPQVRVVPRDVIHSQVISDFSGGPLANQLIGEIAWAPNSSRLAFGAATTNQLMRLYTAAPDGAGFPTLISTTTDQGLSNYLVRWRPDSSEVAYSIWDGAVQSVIAARADGASRTMLLTNVLARCTPEISWSPNGNRVAIVGSVSSTEECALYSVNADGTGMNELDSPSHPEAYVSWMTWMIDNSRIVFMSNRDKLGQNAFTTQELYMCSADGNASVKLSDDLGVLTPVWNVTQL